MTLISFVFSPVDGIRTSSPCYFMDTQAVEFWLNICSPKKKKLLNGRIGFDGSLNHVSNLFGLICFQPVVRGGLGPQDRDAGLGPEYFSNNSLTLRKRRAGSAAGVGAGCWGRDGGDRLCVCVCRGGGAVT